MNPNAILGGESANNGERSREQLRAAGDKGLESTKAALIKDVQVGLAQLESMGRRNFKDKQAEANNNAQMEREYAKLQEIVARNGLDIQLPPLKLNKSEQMDSMPTAKATVKVEAPAAATETAAMPQLDSAMVAQMMGGAVANSATEGSASPESQDVLVDGDSDIEHQAVAEGVPEENQPDTIEPTASNEITQPAPEESPAVEVEDISVATEVDAEQPDYEQISDYNEPDETARREESLKVEAEANAKAAREEGYKQAQREIANILNGRSIEQAISDYEADITNLNEEIEFMEKRVYLDPEAQEAHQQRISEAKADLVSMQRRQDIVKNLQTGENPVDMAEGAPVRFDRQAASGALDDNNPVTETSSEALAEDEVAADAAAEDSEAVDDKEKVDSLDDLIRQAYDETVRDVESKGNWDERIAELSEEIEQVREYITMNEANVAALIVQRDQLGKNNPNRNTYDAQILVVEKSIKAYKNRYKILEAKRAAAQAVAEKHQDEAETAGADLGKETLKKNIFERLKSKQAFKNLAKRAAVFALALVISGGIISGTISKAKAVDEVDNDPSKQASEGAIKASRTEDLYKKLGIEFDESSASEAEEAVAESGITIEDLSELGANYETAENGVFYNYDEYNGYGNRADKHSWNAFGMDKSYLYESQDVDETANAIYKIAHEQPEVLATFVSNYPTLLAECGLNENLTAKEIDDLISNSEDGGKLQQKLLDAFEQLLESDNTSFEFSLATNRVQTPYMVLDKGNNPAGHRLAMDERTRANEPQVKVTYTTQDKDGNSVVYAMYLNLECGFQPNIFQESPIVTPAGKPEVVVAQTPTTPEVAPNEPHTPIMVVELQTPEEEEKPSQQTPETPPDTPPAPPEDPPKIPEEIVTQPTEKIKKKDAQSIIDAGSLGLGDNNNISQTKNFEDMTPGEINNVGDGQVKREDIIGDLTGVYQETGEQTPTNNNESNKVEQSVADSTLSEAEQEQVRQNVQEAEKAADAMQEEGARPEGADEIADYYQSLMDTLADASSGTEYQAAVDNVAEANSGNLATENAGTSNEANVETGAGLEANSNDSGLTEEPQI